MPLPKSREWLDRLLNGLEPSESELRQLVQDCPDEDQWIEYKAGVARGPDDLAAKLRRQIAGFANADGGALVIGYRHADRRFDGAEAPGGGALKDWTSRVLTPLRTGSTLPQPRFAVTRLDGVEVLLVSVGRARMPVADIRRGAPVFFARMGDQTLEMPQWLVTDLLLGRRAQPDLRIFEIRNVSIEEVRYPGAMRSSAVTIETVVRFENDALQFAELARPGLVTWTTGREGAIPQQARRSVDLQDPPADRVSGGYPWQTWSLAHRTCQPADVEPLRFGEGILPRWQIPVFRRFDSRDPATAAEAGGSVELKAAVYVFARNAEPSWWQLTLRYDERALGQLTQPGDRYIRFEPCFYSRPVVSLRFLDEGEPVEFPQPPE